MTNVNVSGSYDNTTEIIVTCASYVSIVQRMNTLIAVIWYFGFALGVSGNVLSVVIWLRRHVVGKNSSAVYLATLAVNDLVYQLISFLLVDVFGCELISECITLRYIIGVAMLVEPLLVLGFSVERLVAILRPLKVFHARGR